MVSPLESPPLAISPLAMSHSHTFTFPEAGMRTKLEKKRKEAVWDLFQSESTFLRDHLMAIKNVSADISLIYSVFLLLEVFMEPLKKVQVEGYVMFAEPEVLFGNLDELCCVSFIQIQIEK